MEIAQVIGYGLEVLQLVERLVAEGRAATAQEVESLLASVKARQKTEEDDWNAPLPGTAGNPPTETV